MTEHTEQTCKIIRFRFQGENQVIKRGLTLAEAQAWCSRDDTHGGSAEECTTWFDGYELEADAPSSDEDDAPADDAPFDLVDQIIAYEQGDLDDDATIVLFQHLVDNGQAWQLQGHYGRTAAALIEAGLVTTAIHKARAKYDNPSVCVSCGEHIKIVPGGHGPTAVHAATGAVAGRGPEVS